jgi:hypothetical protein
MWWLEGAPIPAENRFAASLTNLAAAELDLTGMGLGTGEVLTGDLTVTGAPLELRLLGIWAEQPQVSLDALPAQVQHDAEGLLVTVPVGTHTLQILP